MVNETPGLAERFGVSTEASAGGKVTAVSRPIVNQVEKGSDAVNGLINILSYDLATTKAEELAARGFQVYVLDESHYIKSRTAKRVQSLLPVIGKAKRVILLSGTPTLSRPSELFPQVHLLRRDVFGSFHPFGERYCAGKKERFGWNFEGHSNLEELNIVLETLCMIRRTKDEVLTELPPKTRERIVLKMSPEQLSLIEKGIRNFCAIEAKKDLDPISRKAAFMTLWREVGRVKLPSIIEYVNDLLEAGEKFLVFCHHM